MLSFLVVSFLIRLVAGLPPATNDGRIVGGHDISIEEAPYQISLEEFGEHGCGGSIISATHILTAGHCPAGISPSKLAVRAGTAVRESGGQLVNVSAYHIHPKYTHDIGNYDIAILELASPLVFGKTVAPIKLASRNQRWPGGTEVFVTGWGLLEEMGNRLPTILQGVTVEIIDPDTCKTKFGESAPNVLCAGVDGGGKDACQADSGGPLVVDGTLAGIVSRGVGCAEAKHPGIYTSVAVFRDYIQEITGI